MLCTLMLQTFIVVVNIVPEARLHRLNVRGEFENCSPVHDDKIRITMGQLVASVGADFSFIVRGLFHLAHRRVYRYSIQNKYRARLSDVATKYSGYDKSFCADRKSGS